MNAFYISILMVVLLGIAGWVSNIVQLIHLAQADNIHAMFWVKCVGVLAAPVGSVLGIAGWF
jgi:hypothetical protein